MLRNENRWSAEFSRLLPVEILKGMHNETIGCNLLVILTESPPENSATRLLSARILAASLFRSQFGGDVCLLSSRDHQLFRVVRAGFSQVHVPQSQPDSIDYWAQRESLGKVLKSVITERPGSYILVSDG